MIGLDYLDNAQRIRWRGVPFTFFAHQTVVMPIKLAAPRWFDGTALCIGSMAPDLAYAIDDSLLHFHSHSLTAQLYWTLPLTLALLPLWRRVICGPLGAALGGRLGAALTAMAHARRPLWMSAIGAVLGGLSHLFVDGFTHGDYTGWAVHRIPWLEQRWTFMGVTQVMCSWMQDLGHTVGTALGAAMLAFLIARGYLLRWAHAETPAAPSAPSTFPHARRWIGALAAVGAAVGVALVLLVHAPIATSIIRVSWCMFAGVALGAVVARRA